MLCYKQFSKELSMNPDNSDSPVEFLIDWKIRNDPIAISYQFLDNNDLIGMGSADLTMHYYFSMKII